MGCSSSCARVTWVTGQRAVVAGCEELGLPLPGAPPCCSRPRPQALFQGLCPAGLRRGGQEPGGRPLISRGRRAAVLLTRPRPAAGSLPWGQRAAPGQGRSRPATLRGQGEGPAPALLRSRGHGGARGAARPASCSPAASSTHLRARGRSSGHCRVPRRNLDKLRLFNLHI